MESVLIHVLELHNNTVEKFQNELAERKKEFDIVQEKYFQLKKNCTCRHHQELKLSSRNGDGDLRKSDVIRFTCDELLEERDSMGRFSGMTPPDLTMEETNGKTEETAGGDNKIDEEVMEELMEEFHSPTMLEKSNPRKKIKYDEDVTQIPGISSSRMNLFENYIEKERVVEDGDASPVFDTLRAGHGDPIDLSSPEPVILAPETCDNCFLSPQESVRRGRNLEQETKSLQDDNKIVEFETVAETVGFEYDSLFDEWSDSSEDLLDNATVSSQDGQKNSLPTTCVEINIDSGGLLLRQQQCPITESTLDTRLESCKVKTPAVEKSTVFVDLRTQYPSEEDNSSEISVVEPPTSHVETNKSRSVTHRAGNLQTKTHDMSLILSPSLLNTSSGRNDIRTSTSPEDVDDMSDFKTTKKSPSDISSREERGKMVVTRNETTWNSSKYSSSKKPPRQQLISFSRKPQQQRGENLESFFLAKINDSQLNQDRSRLPEIIPLKNSADVGKIGQESEGCFGETRFPESSEKYDPPRISPKLQKPTKTKENLIVTDPDETCLSEERGKRGNYSNQDDSFDKVQKKSTSPRFAYRTDAVRKREERRKLQGFECQECRNYYGDRLGENADRIQHCSRHRAKYIPPSTPEHYWSLGIPDTQECKQRGYMLQPEPELNIIPRKRRRKPLNLEQDK